MAFVCNACESSKTEIEAASHDGDHLTLWLAGIDSTKSTSSNDDILPKTAITTTMRELLLDTREL